MWQSAPAMTTLLMAALFASLPRVPAQPRVPQLPPELRGLTFRVRGLIADSGKCRYEMDPKAEDCMTRFEKWMGAAGLVPVREGGDLVIDEYCGINLSIDRHGNLLHISHPPWQNTAIVVWRDGAPLVTVPRGPADYVCESSGTPQQMVRDCMARSEAWAQIHIIEVLSASPELAELARCLKGAP
jgi:hypothetical protein